MQTVNENTIFSNLKQTGFFQVEIRGIKWRRVAGQNKFVVKGILKIDFKGICFRFEGTAMNI